ncbi:acyltransferase family protein [Pseudomonas sp. zbq_18]|uniref:acyltransferase family protein n=1 Tax=Pseudomonadota TaxID=1224 RepID=UPI00370BA490
MFNVIAGLRQPSAYIPQLESLRGWAILLVVAFHFFGILRGESLQLPEESPIWLRVIGAGNTGVTLFFVLSGFLLARPFIKAFRSGAKVNIGQFYLARLLRIIPLYYIAVFVAWLVTKNSVGAFKALWFIPVGFDIFPFSVPWWSLCTEVQFYLLLPWLMLALHYRWGRWLVACATASWLMLHGAHLLQPQWLGLPAWSESSLFGRGVAFLVGGLAAWFHVSSGYAKVFRSPWLVGLLALLLFAALIGLLQWYGLVGQKAAMRSMPFYHDLEALLWAGLLLCSLAPLAQGAGIFINPLISHFGTISYSLYLVHVPLQFYLIYPFKAAGSDISDSRMLVAVVGSFVLSWLLAILCYHAIEKPFLKLKAHLPILSDRLRGHPAKA